MPLDPARGAPPLSDRSLWLSRAARLPRNWRERHTIARAPVVVAAATTAPAASQTTQPVFVLSAGWRSGSTALQRLIISGGHAFIWGEPFPTARLLPRLERIVAEAPVLDGQDRRVLPSDEITPTLWSSWVAVTNPAPTVLATGARAMLESVYWQPLAGSQFQTWGTKEVTATPRQMAFLRGLYPDGRYVCVVRDPVAAYRSFRRFVVSGVIADDGPSTRLRWVRGPVSFARHWTRCASYFRSIRGCDNALVLRYEDIQGRQSFPDELGRWLGMRLEAEAWSARVGGVPGSGGGRLEEAELAVVSRLTHAEARRWGYGDARP